MEVEANTTTHPLMDRAVNPHHTIPTPTTITRLHLKWTLGATHRQILALGPHPLNIWPLLLHS